MSADRISFVSNRNTGAGLSDRECYVLAKAAPELPGAWRVQYDEDDQGHGSMALVPDRSQHDQVMTVFLVWREAGRLHLGLGQGDFYAGLGTHPDVETLIRAVQHTLDGTAVVDRWLSCELGSTTWKNGSALSMHEQSRRPN